MHLHLISKLPQSIHIAHTEKIDLLCMGWGLISGLGLTYGVNDVAGVNGGVGLPGTGLCW